LYDQGKRKIMMQAQDVMRDLLTASSDDESQSKFSHIRKGVQDLVASEERELRFKPTINPKSSSMSREGSIEDRLTDDAYKRKLRHQVRMK
jgi:hypothetical protein